MRKSILFAAFILFFIILASASSSSSKAEEQPALVAQADGDPTLSIYMPIIYKIIPSATLTFTPTATTAPSAIIIDHRNTDIDAIPDYWIDQAQALLRVSYGHSSHGSQLIAGLDYIVGRNKKYAFNKDGAIQADILSIADNTPSGDLGDPDRVTWEARTRAYLNSTGSNRNVVMWSWCGQVDASEAEINTYLTLMTGLINDYPTVKFVFMTGHLNGGGPTGNVYLRNNQIRNYVQAHNFILFDFADIESYDPSGTYYPNADDSCPWCNAYCSSHPGFCPSVAESTCAHSKPLNCYLKGRAYWWLLARLAGWNGVTS